MWIGHNPSSADADRDDPTLHRMKAFTHEWGYGRLSVVNLLPIRTSSPYEAHKWFWEQWPPEEWFTAKGRAKAIMDNARAIHDHLEDAAKVVACWGAIAGPIQNLANDVRHYFAQEDIPLYVLGLTQDGSPAHPLGRGKGFIPTHTKPTVWE